MIGMRKWPGQFMTDFGTRVLFADIRNFVSYTEQHTGPEVIRTLNHVFEALSRVVFTHKGTFDKYLGDGLMVFYGAPVAGDDDAQRAVATAVEMQQLFEEMRAATRRSRLFCRDRAYIDNRSTSYSRRPACLLL